MMQSTIGDFIRTIRKVVFFCVALSTVMIVVFGGIFFFFSVPRPGLTELSEWRGVLGLPFLAATASLFVGWGLAIRNHAHERRFLAFMIGAVLCPLAAVTLSLLGFSAAGVSAGFDSFTDPRALPVCLYFFFLLASFVLIPWGYFWAGWLGWMYDFD